MAVNRYDEYVDASILSILNQSFKNIEFIIVANGEKHKEIHEELNAKYHADIRVRIHSLPIGQLAFALNYAISISRYDIIARMDADDISISDRLQKQYCFLNENNLDLVGTAIQLINENDLVIGDIFYPDSAKIKKVLKFKNCFAHPTIMFRKKIFLKCRGYNGGFNSEDYDLWVRMSEYDPRWDNMQECLLSYRVHTNSTQRSKLAYCECAGYSLRDFLKSKTIKNFLAFIYHTAKALVK